MFLIPFSLLFSLKTTARYLVHFSILKINELLALVVLKTLHIIIKWPIDFTEVFLWLYVLIIFNKIKGSNPLKVPLKTMKIIVKKRI